LVRKAAIALYQAKLELGSAFSFFEPAMDAFLRERDLIERELRVAITAGVVRPYFQPMMDLGTNRVVGFEALARWTHPEFGEISPDRFIQVAERCGLINALTDQILRRAIEAAGDWPPEISLSINISPLQLKDESLAARILLLLRETGLSPHRLEIELTESALVQNLEGAQKALGALRAAGVRIALDDFGTGYSSLYHLRNFKVDSIKIDRSFIEDLEEAPETAALVRGLMGLGHGLGLKVTAEGVEESAQARVLLAQGCDLAQGYLYGRAMSAADACTFLESQSRHVLAPLLAIGTSRVAA
jgi:EAL domain-containing protein (putative c-di-GMP-specific phosphodiesterase class I)